MATSDLKVDINFKMFVISGLKILLQGAMRRVLGVASQSRLVAHHPQILTL